MDIKNLSHAQLTKLISEAEGRLDSLNKAHEVRAKVEALIKEAGLTIQDCFPEFDKAGGKVKSSVAPKYKHPENAGLTWSGRGRKPKWFAEALEQGVTEEDMKI